MADSNEDPLQKLSPSIVEIISDKEEENSRTLGTGFVVSDDGLVVTCRHVITTDSQDKLMNTVKVRFHTDGKTDVKFTASRVLENQNFRDDPSIDIAFLRLNKLPEKGVIPVKLDDKVVSSH
jgi:S1-C subfamily serine protease